ncbi:MAG TPA: aromatic amino acid hydroxylase [Cytophagaceae bacterium]
MELNEVTQKLPPHLMQFVIDQPYNQYTAVDQAVWRYVMRQNYNFLKHVAHESYIEGLRKTGVGIESIPTMYGMNRILKEIGWAAVAVDGFIPPGAFMEFTKYNVLVIAADIRTLEHIEYTPAPDIIHESAGHAPIIADPEFAAYLVYIGEVGSKAFSSKKDFELYEAIRHLSIIKEDPNTPPEDIIEAEKAIEEISANMGEPSEMALIRNLHWWTVEYGLIGTLDNFKIYGAGLLSSIGESASCLKPEVKKLPYTIEAAYCNYDITKTQPQLFVTPDFKHLTVVLNEFMETMALKHGGTKAIQKAIRSEYTATCVYSSGLQVSGTFVYVEENNSDTPTYFTIEGPAALAYKDIELKGFGKSTFPSGFIAPVGCFKDISKSPEKLSDDELTSLGIVSGRTLTLPFKNGIIVRGIVKDVIRNEENLLMLITLTNSRVSYKDRLLFESDFYALPIGEKIVSGYAGAADIEAYQPTANVPREKTHKINYDVKTQMLHSLYQQVRDIRESNENIYLLPKIWQMTVEDFPSDWLLSMEVLEILHNTGKFPIIEREIKEYLEAKQEKEIHLKKLISDGLKLIFNKNDEKQ